MFMSTETAIDTTIASFQFQVDFLIETIKTHRNSGLLSTMPERLTELKVAEARLAGALEIKNVIENN